MSKSEELLALAERCEVATGACFKLETDIAYVIGAPLAGIAKPYTASLDAAMMLVPEACYPWIEFGKNRGMPVSRLWSGCISALDEWDRQRVQNEWFCDVEAATPALALCAAALRARAAMEE